MYFLLSLYVEMFSKIVPIRNKKFNEFHTGLSEDVSLSDLLAAGLNPTTVGHVVNEHVPNQRAEHFPLW